MVDQTTNKLKFIPGAMTLTGLKRAHNDPHKNIYDVTQTKGEISTVNKKKIWSYCQAVLSSKMAVTIPWVREVTIKSV